MCNPTMLPRSYVTLLMPVYVMALLADVTEHACPGGCTCLPGTRRVDCRAAGIDRIIWNLPEPGTLEVLIMAENKIQKIINEIVTYVNLRELDLSQNEILRISSGVFDTLPRLQYLYLQYNELQAITENMFVQRRSSLIELNLSNNEIESIGNAAFRSLGNLTSLRLANNRLSEFTSDMISGLVSLRFLYLQNNQITHLTPEVFESTVDLDTLVLDMNSISNISGQLFKFVTSSLRKLSLEGNGISRLPEFLFRANMVPALEELVLKNNDLRQVPSSTLKHLSNLRILDLSHNPITLLDPDAFKGLDELTSLYINNCNELTIVRDYSLSELFSLETIEISSNPKLKQVERNAFISSHNLKNVRLKDNALTTLDVGLLPWSRLDTLVVTGNQWHCDCELSFLAEVLGELLNSSLKTAEFKIREARCSLPEVLTGSSIVDLSREQFMCSAALSPDGTATSGDDSTPEFNRSIMIAIICTFAGALLTCLAFLLWRTRHQNFHNDPRDQQTHRRRRLRKINREFSNCSDGSNIKEGPKLVSVASFGSASNRPFAADGPMDGVGFNDDDVFGNDPDIVTSSQQPFGRDRKVSFSDRVVVRTYECIDETMGSCTSLASDDSPHTIHRCDSSEA